MINKGTNARYVKEAIDAEWGTITAAKEIDDVWWRTVKQCHQAGVVNEADTGQRLYIEICLG